VTRIARLEGETDIAGFRAAARAAFMADVAPATIRFVAGDETADLFATPAPDAAEATPAPHAREAAGPARDVRDAGAGRGATGPARRAAPRASRRFLDLVDTVGRHRAAERFDLLYAALWRLGETPGLLDIASDPLVRRLEDMARAVRRDRHKMTAFTRFREIDAPEGTRSIAWFEPDHFIEEWTAPFFVDRFAALRFAILTPRRSILWDGRLRFGPGARRQDAPADDAFSSAWDVYFRSTFNPARLSEQAMLKEMPKKYWRNLPETRQIPALVAGARARAEAFLAAAPTPASARVIDLAALRAKRRKNADATATESALDALRRQARACRRCPLGACATQTVFGEGPAQARLILVGEQPGDREDLEGRPFVGPAGAVLAQALDAVGLARGDLYLTNAVKHFKHEPRGKRRLHKTPATQEIDVCRWWLAQELAAVAAPVVVALGASALRGLAGDAYTGETLSSLRGRALRLGERALVVTVHPSFLLRLPDAAAREKETARFRDDLARAAALAQATSGRGMNA
jgi:DNA polymerase